ncbi:uncharacterized protein ACWYII_023246 isoform 1-T1 [Salvelinus alpinus]|uniref:uncharacterized protein isoform X1 n=1 Tax=Salvelinus alpinus TaxID=8036 RepID=UPI0039FDC62B
MPFLEAGGLLGVIGKEGKSSSDTGMTVVWQLKRAKGEKVKYEVADLTSVYDEADEELSDGERGRTMTGSLMMDGFLKFPQAADWSVSLLIGADPALSSGYSCIPLDSFSSYIASVLLLRREMMSVSCVGCC